MADSRVDEILGERAVADDGVTIVTLRCIGVTHGLLGLGPGPYPRA
jgi:hypothetical protein